MDIILVFETTHNALSAEQLLRNSDVALEILPTPREITASCGISIRVRSGSVPQISALVETGTLKIHAIYEENKTDRIYTRI